MSIGIIFGPDGSGKSLFQLHIAVKQLRETKRNIVTSLAIKMPEFCAYLSEKYPDEHLDPWNRIRILTAAEVVEFWKYRGCFKITGGGHDPSDPLTITEDMGANGVCYIIDEAGQNGFSAAGWAQKDSQGSHDRSLTRGGRCLWYLEQHRKLNDDVFASTNGRFPTGIAKPFRDKAKEFIRLRNGYQRKMGVFKAQGRFTRESYASEPGPNVECFEKGYFLLDLPLCNCYRTEEGVGILGSSADKGRKAKGIPVMMVFPMVIAAGSLIVFVPYALGHVLSSHMTGVSSAVHTKVAGAEGALSGVIAPPSRAVEPEPTVRQYYTGVMTQSGETYVAVDNEWVRVVGPGRHGYLLTDGTYAYKEPETVKKERLKERADEQQAYQNSVALQSNSGAAAGTKPN